MAWIGCPACAKSIQSNVEQCPYCGHWVKPRPAAPVGTMLGSDGAALKKCPFCAELIQSEAIICRYCNRELSASKSAPQTPQLHWAKKLTAGVATGCPKCGKTVRVGDDRCQYCGVALPPPAAEVKTAYSGLPGSKLATSKKIIIGVVLFFGLALVGALVDDGKSTRREAPSAPPPRTALAEPKDAVPTTPSATTTEFIFDVSAGERIVATTANATDSGEKRTVVFSPTLEKTDGNLYLAALQCLWNLYGKERGLFQSRDASLHENASLGGNAICWRVSNPAADYCIFPIKDSETGRIAALTVWVE